MKNLAVVVAGLLVLTGCSSVEPEDVSLPVQTEEAVQDTRPSDDDVLVEVTPSTDEGELEPVDAPIVEEEVVQEDVQEVVQVSEPEVSETPEYDEDVIIAEPSFESTYLDYITDLNTCKLQQTNRVGYENKGFPYSTGQAARSLGTVNIALVAMDFDNAVGLVSVGQRFGDVPTKMKQWSDKWSRGNMQYNVQFHPEWIRAPKGAEWYNCPECHGEGVRKQSREDALNQVISAIDPYYNLRDIDFIAIVVPEKADKEFYFGVYGPVSISTNEGTQSFGIFGGLGINENIPTLWDTLIHESLHFQGFVGHGPGNGTEYGVMQMQWGRSKAINIWEGFLAGWYDEEEVACVEASDIDAPIYGKLSSLDSFGAGHEGLVIRLNAEEAIVVEHRTVFGSELLAYKLNVNAPSYRNDMGGRLADERNWWSYILEGDGNVRIDKSVSFGEVTIKNLGDGRLEISR